MTTDHMIALAEGQLESYNKGDIEDFCRFYHPDIQVFRLGQVPEKICEGMKNFREIYHERFQTNPELRERWGHHMSLLSIISKMVLLVLFFFPDKVIFFHHNLQPGPN